MVFAELLAKKAGAPEAPAARIASACTAKMGNAKKSATAAKPHTIFIPPTTNYLPLLLRNR